MELNYKVIDNFLPEEDFNNLQNLVIGSRDNHDFYWYMITEVANRVTHEDFDQKTEDQFWNWYGAHRIYDVVPLSSHFNYIANLFFNRLNLIVENYSVNNSISIILRKENLLMAKKNLDITSDIFNLFNEKIEKLTIK